ncbi:unnamed protein product [Amaranthus hypochondriacus]
MASFLLTFILSFLSATLSSASLIVDDHHNPVRNLGNYYIFPVMAYPDEGSLTWKINPNKSQVCPVFITRSVQGEHGPLVSPVTVTSYFHTPLIQNDSLINLRFEDSRKVLYWSIESGGSSMNASFVVAGNGDCIDKKGSFKIVDDSYGTGVAFKLQYCVKLLCLDVGFLSNGLFGISADPKLKISAVYFSFIQAAHFSSFNNNNNNNNVD